METGSIDPAGDVTPWKNFRLQSRLGRRDIFPRMQISDNSVLSTALSEFVNGGTPVITRKDASYDRFSFIQSSRTRERNIPEMRNFQ